MKQKLIDGKDSAFASKNLIQLHQVEAAQKKDLSDFQLHLDFNLFKKVLIQDHNFHSMEKTLIEMQKKFETPMQTSLF